MKIGLLTHLTGAFIVVLGIIGCAPIALPQGATHAAPALAVTPFTVPAPDKTAVFAPTFAPLPGAPVTPTVPCPVPTQELFWVEPPKSPTDQLSQTIAVHIGNGEQITVTTESGVFTSIGDAGIPPSGVTVSLVPNAVNHLEVTARVRLIKQSNGCSYGGYTMSTTRDRTGAQLVVVQGSPKQRVPTVAISPANAGRLQQLGSITPPASLTNDFDFLTNEQLVTIGYKDGLSLWSANVGQEILPIGKERLNGLVLALNPAKTHVATLGTPDSPILRLWDIETGTMRELGASKSTPTSLAFSPSGKRLASGDDGDTVQIWDVASGALTNTFKGDVSHRLQRFARLYWIDDETLLAAASDAIYQWNVTSGKIVRRIAKPTEISFLVDAAFANQGKRVFGVAQDDALYVWDEATGIWSKLPSRPGLTFLHVEMSPDELLVAAGTANGEMMIADAAARKWLASYKMLGSGLAAIRFSPDSRYVAIGGADAPIWLWGIP